MRALTVETLDAKLSRLLPGAVVRYRIGVPSEHAWLVEQKRLHRSEDRFFTLATGASKREAIERAIFLWGAR
jgi:hypothetical protein